MNLSRVLGQRVGALCGGLCCALVLLAGCAPAFRPPDTERAASEATGIRDAIRLSVTGGPIDTDDVIGPALTLADAIGLSLRNEPGVQAALARVRVAQAEAQQARLLPNPILSVAVRFPEGGGKPTIEASLAEDFVAILQRPRRASAADARLRASSSVALSVVLDLLAEVQARYLAVQAAEAQLGVLDERRRINNQLLDLANFRLDKGEGTQFDVTTIQSQQVELETEIAERQLEQRDQRLILARLIGRPSDDAAWRVTEWQPPRQPAANEREWVKLALLHRPEVQARRWELAALGDDLALTDLYLLQGSEIGAATERDDKWTLGPAVTVPLPFFDWGQARRASVQARIVEARHNLTLTRRQIVEEVRRAYLTFTVTQATLARVQSQLIPLQQRRRDQAQAAFLAGQTDITAVRVAEQGLLQARTALVDLQRRSTDTFIRLERAVGAPAMAQTDLTAPPPATRPAPATAPATQPTP